MAESSFGVSSQMTSTRTGQALTVLTINLCVLPPGLYNRYLPRFLQLGAFLGSVALVCGIIYGCHLHPLFWLSWPLVFMAVLFTMAVPLTRYVLGPLLSLSGYDDYKNERLDLFAQALGTRSEWADVDVICLQECCSTMLWSGGFVDHLVKAVKAHGFDYSVSPCGRPVCPATCGVNLGLLILSKRPIVRSEYTTFAFSLEVLQANRGAMHAELQGGVHIFTCHLSPPASVGGGILEPILHRLIEASRKSQLRGLARFINLCAPVEEPVVLAGDFNFDVDFDSFGAPALPSLHAKNGVLMLAEKCRLVEATTSLRCPHDGPATTVARSESSSRAVAFAWCRPTFGYCGDGEGQGPAELWLSSYGNGRLGNSCSDAIFFRGFDGVDVAEDCLAIPAGLSPRAGVTHLSDHWGVRLRMHLAAEPQAGAGDFELEAIVATCTD